MNVGFTGTQRGISPERLDELRNLLAHLRERGFDTLHHGDCVGADAQAHEAALKLGYRIWLHPPMDDKKRAHCTDAHFTSELRTYRARNHKIVRYTAILIAAPRGSEKSQPYSGTWMTVRMARKAGKEIFFI